MNQRHPISAVEQIAGESPKHPDPPPAEPLSAWGIVGRSAGIREAIGKIEKAAASHRGVLIVGEPGTGRTSVARAIHERGVTASGPFVSVDAQAIPSVDAEVALFGNGQARSAGHRPGRSHETLTPGSLAHQALGGTLYFQHLEELPDRVQARLARLLRDGEASIGSRGTPQPILIRAVASVAPNNQCDVADGRLRLDLYRRFASLIVSLPPLRDRAEDIPLLAAHLIGRACVAASLPGKRLTADAEVLLSAVPWRGNVHELRGLLETLVLVSAGPSIGLEDVVAHLHLETAPTLEGRLLGVSRRTLREARARFEQEYIAAVLSMHRGRIGEAAKTLGIQRPNLYRKLRSLHIKLMRDREPTQQASANG